MAWLCAGYLAFNAWAGFALWRYLTAERERVERIAATTGDRRDDSAARAAGGE